MFKKLLEVILAIIPFLKQIFSKENKKARDKKKIEERYEKKKTRIDAAIIGKEDIDVVTDDILGDDGLDELPLEKEGGNH